MRGLSIFRSGLYLIDCFRYFDCALLTIRGLHYFKLPFQNLVSRKVMPIGFSTRRCSQWYIGLIFRSVLNALYANDATLIYLFSNKHGIKVNKVAGSPKISRCHYLLVCLIEFYEIWVGLV